MKSTSRNSNLSFSFFRGWSVWYPVRRDTPIDGGIALFAPVFEGKIALPRLSSVRKSLLLRQQLKTPIFCGKKILTHKISGFLFLCYAEFDLFCYIFVTSDIRETKYEMLNQLPFENKVSTSAEGGNQPIRIPQNSSIFFPSTYKMLNYSQYSLN